MSGRRPQRTGRFVHRDFWSGERSYSPEIHCMDVLDSFPCLTCGAGMNGRDLRCRNEQQAHADLAIHREWQRRIEETPL